MKKCKECGIEKELNQFYNNFRLLDGKFGKCKEWSSIKEASINVNGFGCNISFCCKGKAKTAYGYIWRYKNG